MDVEWEKSFKLGRYALYLVGGLVVLALFAQVLSYTRRQYQLYNARNQCDAGEAAACTEIGAAVAVGRADIHDIQRGLGWLTRGCRLGDARGCRYTGLLLEKGDESAPGDVDAGEVRAAYDRACDADKPGGCLLAGRAYLKRATDTDRDERARRRAAADGVDRLERACRRGWSSACRHAAALLTGHTPPGWSDRRRDAEVPELPGGTGRAERLERATKLLERAEESKDRSAVALRAEMLSNDGETNRAITQLESACREGSISACEAYRSGVEESQYPALERETLAANCRRGRAPACADLPGPLPSLRACLLDGEHCTRWEGASTGLVPESLLPLDIEALRRRCRDGAEMACTLVGQMTEADADAEASPTKWFEKGCQAGDPVGCDRLAYLRESDGAEPAETLPLYRKACRQGVGVACRRQVILRAANNLLDEGGPGEVWRLHRRVCRRDVYPPICRDHEPVDWLALRHHPEHVVEPGSTVRGTAMVFYDRTCRADDKYGCWLWGKSILRSAERVHRASSWSRATDRWQRACDMNHRAACTRLAEHYMQVAPENPARLERAEELLAKACRRRYFDACMTLGRALREGGELPANPERAASVFEGACKAGHQPACDPEAATDGLDIPSD